jgi:mono/diheme cytochrome c family protein
LLVLGLGGALLLTAGPGLADTDDAAKRGEQVFASNGCGWCHESGGKHAGKGPQLMNTKRDDSFIAFRVTHGKEGAMPAFPFTGEQIADIVAYIRSLKED